MMFNLYKYIRALCLIGEIFRADVFRDGLLSLQFNLYKNWLSKSNHIVV